jgi:regulatory protein
MPATISALEIQKHNKERVSVFLEGEYAFSLTLIEAARLHKGQTLSDTEIADLRAQDSIERAVDQAVRFLSYRPRSTSEIRDNLTRKQYPPEAIEAALERLARLGYVDDLAFARYWVSNRDEFRPKGPLALRQELREKGITGSLCDQVLAEVDFADAAYRAAQRANKRLSGLDQTTFRQKLYEYLARRGFRTETIRDVTERLLEELEISPDDESLNFDDM